MRPALPEGFDRNLPIKFSYHDGFPSTYFNHFSVFLKTNARGGCLSTRLR